MEEAKGSRWKSRRGEWYVVLQLILFAVILFGPRTAAGLPPWPAALSPFFSVAGGALMAAGAAMTALAALHLGPNLTPLPHPKDDATLVVTGLYGLVRHPIYSGLILMAFGWALWVQGWLTLAYALALTLFFDLKSRREEVWLERKFPDYAGYRRRVRKLIPFVY